MSYPPAFLEVQLFTSEMKGSIEGRDDNNDKIHEMKQLRAELAETNRKIADQTGQLTIALKRVNEIEEILDTQRKTLKWLEKETKSKKFVAQCNIVALKYLIAQERAERLAYEKKLKEILEKTTPPAQEYPPEKTPEEGIKVLAVFKPALGHYRKMLAASRTLMCSSTGREFNSIPNSRQTTAQGATVIQKSIPKYPILQHCVIQPKTSNTKKFGCKLCKKTFRWFSKLKEHLWRTHKVHKKCSTVGCSRCGQIFTDRKRYFRHDRLAHGRKHRRTPLQTKERPFTCSGTSSFPSKTDSSTPTPNSLTNESFATEHGLMGQDPLKSITRYTCICGKLFIFRLAFQSHVRVRCQSSRNLKFKCIQCPDVFSTYEGLHEHLTRTHKIRLFN